MRKIITIKNNLIKDKSLEVKNVDNEIREVVENMNYMRNKYNGVGLAAIQIGVLKRIITIDLTGSNMEDSIIKPLKITLVNPKILSFSERIEDDTEGCLSIPGRKGNVLRHFWVEIEGYTLDNEYYHKKLYDLAARVAQHEIDHLNGILFIDKIKNEDK